MGKKRILGLVILLGGIALMMISYYIDQRVFEGREEISAAQKKVDRGNAVFSLAPSEVQPLTKGFTGSAQRQIDAASSEADLYSNRARLLWIGGIGLIIVGIGVMVFGKKHR